MDQQDRDLFAQALQQAITQSRGDRLDAALTELGWTDALADDPRAAVELLFSQQGGANATSSALAWVMADALGAQGAAVVLPALGTTVAPGSLGQNGLAVQGVMTPAALDEGSALVVTAGSDGEHRAVLVDAALLPQRSATGVDPNLGPLLVSGAGIDVAGVSVEGPADLLADGAWETAVAVGQRALAHELVGASRTMLELARTHAIERIQFGQPIAQFQAVRHRLAESLVAVEGAAAAVDAAWLDGSPFAASAAKAVAGRSARTVSRHCQQVMAGIGFTTEHPFHLYARRVLVLDQLLGSSRRLTKQLGAELLRTRRVPPLLPL
jgi:alkylation response protein AidB-like acyl-CoA dehydrogenase